VPFPSPRPLHYKGDMKPRLAAVLALGVELSGCGSRLLRGLSFADWFALASTVPVIAILVVGFVGLAKTIRK
jgi:hypothetical protein